jgi:hypothetical protein
LFIPGNNKKIGEKVDYKKLYLEQKAMSMKMELDLLQIRFVQVQKELPEVIAELEAYSESKEKEEK